MWSPSSRLLVVIALGTLGAFLSQQRTLLGAPPSERNGSLGPASPFLSQSPKQNEPWTVPPNGLPAKVVLAAQSLFEQGLPDPRGCEYRQVVVTGAWDESWATHAWLLPETAGDKRRLAIAGMD